MPLTTVLSSMPGFLATRQYSKKQFSHANKAFVSDEFEVTPQSKRSGKELTVLDRAQ